jgi:hypothetical protein
VGFAEAGFAFEEDVAAGEEGGEDLMDDFFLADEDLGDGAMDCGKRIADCGLRIGDCGFLAMAGCFFKKFYLL